MDSSLEKLATMAPSEVFETYMVPAIFAPWAEALLDLVQVHSGDSVLDVACGTGKVARTARQRCHGHGRVVGLDFNPGQLEVAQGLVPAIEWREGSATSLPFDNQEFDVVTCQQGLQFFPDRQAAVREMCRVLAPGGCLAISVWCTISTKLRPRWNLHGTLRQLCGFHFGIGIVQGTPPCVMPWISHVGEETVAPTEAIFSFADPDQLQLLLDKSSLRESAVRSETKLAHFPPAEDFVAIFLRGPNLARLGITIEDGTFKELQAEVSVTLKPYVQANGIALPMTANLASARK